MEKLQRRLVELQIAASKISTLYLSKNEDFSPNSRRILEISQPTETRKRVGTQGYNKTINFPLGRIMREKAFPRASDGRMNAGLV
jgi:hypothetical protein